MKNAFIHHWSIRFFPLVLIGKSIIKPTFFVLLCLVIQLGYSQSYEIAFRMIPVNIGKSNITETAIDTITPVYYNKDSRREYNISANIGFVNKNNTYYRAIYGYNYLNYLLNRKQYNPINSSVEETNRFSYSSHSISFEIGKAFNYKERIYFMAGSSLEYQLRMPYKFFSTSVYYDPTGALAISTNYNYFDVRPMIHQFGINSNIAVYVKVYKSVQVGMELLNGVYYLRSRGKRNVEQSQYDSNNQLISNVNRIDIIKEDLLGSQTMILNIGVRALINVKKK